MAEGTIKFTSDRGFGFILDSESETDIFFHCSNSEFFEELEQGAKVSYQVVQDSEMRLQAEEVQRI